MVLARKVAAATSVGVALLLVPTVVHMARHGEQDAAIEMPRELTETMDLVQTMKIALRTLTTASATSVAKKKS